MLLLLLLYVPAAQLVQVRLTEVLPSEETYLPAPHVVLVEQVVAVLLATVLYVPAAQSWQVRLAEVLPGKLTRLPAPHVV